MVQTVKTEIPELRYKIEAALRAGLPINREALAAEYEVSTGTVQAIRTQISRQIKAAAMSRPVAGRTVMEFDGPRLFELRRARWLMQDQLGRMAIDPDGPPNQRGVSRGEIGHLERTPTGPRTDKDHRKPTLRTMLRLAYALGVEPEDLLELPYRIDMPAKALLEMRDAARNPGKEAAEVEDHEPEAAAQAG